MRHFFSCGTFSALMFLFSILYLQWQNLLSLFWLHMKELGKVLWWNFESSAAYPNYPNFMFYIWEHSVREKLKEET